MCIRLLFVVSSVLVSCVFAAAACAQALPATDSRASAARHSLLAVASTGTTTVHTPQAQAPATSASALQPNALERGLTQVEQVLKVLAYLVGGIWVYFNYFRGRTHRPRLETKVTCEQLRTASPVLLSIGASAKNAGLSKVDLTDKGSAAVIYGYELASGTWKELQAHSVLTKDHEWIEPGETVVDHILVQIDASYPAFQVELWLNSTSKVTWVAKTIVGPVERNDHAATGRRPAGTTSTGPAAAAESGSWEHGPDRRAERSHPTAAATATATPTGGSAEG